MALFDTDPSDAVGSRRKRFLLGLFLFGLAAIFGGIAGALCEAFSDWDDFLDPKSSVESFLHSIRSRWSVWTVIFSPLLLPMGIGAFGFFLILFNFVAGCQLLFSKDLPWLWMLGTAFCCTIGYGFNFEFPDVLSYGFFTLGYACLGWYLLRSFWPDTIADIRLLNPGFGEQALEKELLEYRKKEESAARESAGRKS